MCGIFNERRLLSNQIYAKFNNIKYVFVYKNNKVKL